MPRSIRTERLPRRVAHSTTSSLRGGAPTARRERTSGAKPPCAPRRSERPPPQVIYKKIGLNLPRKNADFWLRRQLHRSLRVAKKTHKYWNTKYRTQNEYTCTLYMHKCLAKRGVEDNRKVAILIWDLQCVQVAVTKQNNASQSS